MKRKSICSMLIVILLFQLVLPVISATKVLAVEIDNGEELLINADNTKLETNLETIKFGSYSSENKEREEALNEIVKESTTVLESTENISEAYLEWNELSEEEKQDTVEPRKEYIDISELQSNDQYVTSAVTIPERYNLREVLSEIKTEYQGSTGNCYAYAGLNSVETNIAIKTGTIYDFSEMHVEYMTSSLLGGNRILNAGGNFQTVVKYSEDLQGPVLESEIANKSYTEDEYSLLKNAKPVVTVTETIEFPTINKRYGYTEEQLTEFRESVKAHIMENGSVYASMYFSESSKYYNSTTKGYACLDTTLLTNHAVSIIGWDDNYLAENFPEANRPVNNGAWIALNSWGNSFGDKGVFYISYEDNWVEYNMSGIVSAIDFVDTYGPKVELSNYTNENNTISTTINIYDIGGSKINTSNLKYQWTQTSEEPSLESFTTTFTNGDTLTKSYEEGQQWYLWILAYDVNGNYTISGAVKELIFKDKCLYDFLCKEDSDIILSSKENENNTYSIFMTQEDIEDITILNFSSCDDIENIQGIENYVNLKYLNIYSNKITSLENINFPNSLEHLDIAYNNLERIDNVTFPSNLKYLRLTGNDNLEITSPFPSTLEHLILDDFTSLKNWGKIELPSNLKILQLSSCDLGDYINEINFPESLTMLTLGNNGITNIDCLKNLTNLTHLCIGANYISDISVIENFKKLQELRAGDVYITDILDGTFFGGQFGRNKNKISNINGISFSDTLVKIDLSCNEITDASNVNWPDSLKLLYLDNNLIENISIDITSNLNYINLDNNKIKDISDIQVSSECTTSRDIIISNNEVENIPAENWQNSRIDRLILSNNNISNIDNVIWPEYLDSLALDGNNISSLNNVTWKEKLRYLILNNNNISAINNVVWPEGIRAIEIANNNIEDLIWIEDLTNLTAVALNQNNIYNIESLSILSKLQEIHLDQNYIEDISTLESLSSLGNLSVKQQNIIKVVDDAVESVVIPQIIQETMKTSSDVYTENEMILRNCTIENDSIIFKTDDLGYIYAIVIGGNADGTTVYITNNTEDKIIKDVYNIKNKEDLIKVKDIINYGHNDLEGSTIQLNNNIDLGGLYNEETDTWSGDIWEPIGNEQYPFAGTFEGNGYKITGLYINTDKDYQGLIGYSYGTIQNLTVEGYINTTGRKAAGICAACYSRDTEKVAIIKNCVNEVDVDSSTHWVAGICAIMAAGKDETAIIENSCNNGDLQGSNYVGGICGHNSTGTYGNSIIRNCYNTGIISGGYEVGGICGLNKSDTWDRETGPTIKNCYNVGFIRGNYNLGGIVGTAEGKYSTIKNCYNVGLVQKSNQSGNIIGSYEEGWTNAGYGIVENCYYYDRSGLKAMDEWGNNFDSFDNELSNVYGITEEYLKSTEFTTLLNVADRECTWINVEDYDYPVFDWQNSILQDETILKEIKLGKAPTKKKYTVNYADGDELDLTGGKIVLIYTYKDEELEVEKSMTEEDLTVSALDNSVLGEQTISVTYKDKTTSFTVTVEDCSHEYGEWIIESQPTDNEEGLKYRICTKCNFREKKAIIEEGVDEIWNISATDEDNVVAKLYDDGTLRISGNGKMKGSTSRPWEDYIDNILKVEILEGVTNIGSYAFWKCSNLESIIISDTVTTIGNSAFAGCESVKSITIPSSVESISNAFRGCSSLENILVDDENQNYSSKNGILFNKEKTIIVKYPGAKLDTVYEIPNGITQIAASAFWESKNLINIEIPNSVMKINDAAFYNCINIQSIILPKSVTYIDSSSLTFYGINSIKAYCGSYAEEYVTKYYSDKLSIIHDYEETTRVEATCLEEGNIIYTCVGCSDTYNEEILATGHTEVIDEKVDATCTQSGLTEGKHCSKCEEVLIAQQIIYALGHEEVIDDAVEATCTEDGSTQGKHCSRCDEVLVAQEVVNALGHEEVIDDAVEATCTKGGLTEGKHCSICDEVLVAQQVVDALGHNHETVVTDSTCTEKGYTTHSCTRCDDEYIDTYTDALGHDYKIKSKDEAVCEQGGKIVYECSRCNASYEETIEPTGHTVVTDQRVEPTCTNTGLTEGSHCSKCKEVLVEQEFIDALGHDYENIVTEPTCTEQGYTTYNCKVCTHSYVDNYVDATGHTVVTDSAVPPTCTETGLTEGSHCFVCNTVIVAQQMVNALGHDYESVVAEPTCTEKGYTTYTCKVCTHNYVDNYVDAKGHTIVTDNAVAPTCTENGLTEGSHCSVCDTVLVTQQVVSALGHDYNSEVIEPTCTEGGYTTHTCTRCSDKYIDGETEARGHSYETVTTNSSCTEGGYTTYKCNKCQHEYVDDNTDSLGHDYVVKEKIEATCKDAGNIVYECSRCKDSYNETIQAKGHIEVIDEAVSATCTETGLTTGKHCSVCEEVLVAQEKVAALGHNFGAWVIDKEATYEEEGHKYRVCTNCNTEKEEQVIPVLEREELQVTTTYTVKEQDGQKFAVMSNVKEVQEILSNITSNKDLEIVDKSGNIIEDTTKVGTGAKVVEKQTKEVVYTVVVKGDANGDGKIDFINDIIRFNNYRLNLIKLDTASVFAGDIDSNEKIDFINDIIRINNYRLGIINSL